MTELERQLLDFEDQRWKYPGAKESAVREQFGWTTTAYYGRLNRLLERPEAAAYAPMLVARLRRLSAARREARPGRRAGNESS